MKYSSTTVTEVIVTSSFTTASLTSTMIATSWAFASASARVTHSPLTRFNCVINYRFLGLEFSVSPRRGVLMAISSLSSESSTCLEVSHFSRPFSFNCVHPSLPSSDELDSWLQSEEENLLEVFTSHDLRLQHLDEMVTKFLAVRASLLIKSYPTQVGE